MNNYQTIADYYAQHRDEIVRFVTMRIGDSDVAQDMVQDIFVRLLRSDKLISLTTLPALTFTMARNMVADWYRRRRIIEEYEHYIIGTGDSHESMESLISAHELMARMEHTLARLAPECRDAYRLHIYAGMQVAQIAEQTHLPYRAVEYRIGQARRAVRQALKQAL
jgi:RNA polymerase sigma-70 factor (ECF subfamily)